MLPRRMVLAALTLSLAAACSDDDRKQPPKTEPLTPPVVQRQSGLVAFESCEQLEGWLEEAAVTQMKATLEESRQRRSYYRGWPPMAEDAMAGAPSADGAKSGPQDYTTTNTQVAGVDEADFVKNDGTRIFVLSGDTLYIQQSWPADQLKTMATVAIEGWPREMFLDDKNHVIVFSTIWEPYPLDKVMGDVCCASLWCGYYYSNTVKVTVIDVSTLSAPQIKDHWYLPGSYQNSRRIGSSVRAVISDEFRWPAGMKWWPDSSDPSLWDDEERLKAAFDVMAAENERLIRDATLATWLPPSKRKVEGGAQAEVAYDCRDFWHSTAPVRLGMVTVATINLDNPNNGISRATVLGEAGEIYASQSSLYVASPHWWWWSQPGQQDYTYVHKFDISNPDKARYVASGGFDGTIVDQFSLDEDTAGNLRVASTITSWVEDTENPQNTWGRAETVNRVSVLGLQDGALKEIGRSEDLAKGERIQSARFLGNVGYVVTFRQIDPLFTFDLSDPTKPTKVGELKVEGFSTYIHPLDATHLMTIGNSIDPSGNWQTRRTQLSIYDVSDLANVRRIKTHEVGTLYGYSEAMHEHKAFNYFPARKLLAIPFWDYDPAHSYDGYYWDSFKSDLKVYEVDLNSPTGFVEKGSVSFKNVYMTWSTHDWTYYWSPWVRRSVMADDFVYAISDAGVRVANIADLSTPVGEALFNRAVEGGAVVTK